MAKFHYSHKLSKTEKEEYFIQLCYVISKSKDTIEAANILKDLLTEQEVEMISKRLQIADSLIDGFTYNEIKRVLKTSDSTIARVHEWLKVAGEGFRAAKEKLDEYNKKENQKRIKEEKRLQNNIRRKYPMYYWPQILLEEIIKNLDKKQKQKLQQILNQMKQKTQLYKQLNPLLKDPKD